MNFPFGGGINPFDMMQQASQLKTKLAEMKTNLQKIELTESAADGKIVVVSTGDGTIKSITIDPDYYAATDSKLVMDELQSVVNRILTRAKQESLTHLKEAAGPFASMLGSLGVDI
ncbi:MAG: YbaB/EbfC family nucleoid-associated protein [bacterium]|nr:YbaB/EbfC family nucleoid-associated protein [bacterium]